MTTTGTTPGAARFITATTTTELEKRAADLTAASGTEIVPVSTKGTGRQTGTPAGAAEIPTVPAQRRGPSTATPRLLEGSVNPAVRAACAQAPSAATTMADEKGAFRHVEAPALAAVVVSRIGKRRIVMFLWPARFRNGESDMRRTKTNVHQFDWANLFETAAAGILLAGGSPMRSVGQQQGGTCFSSPANPTKSRATQAHTQEAGARTE